MKSKPEDWVAAGLITVEQRDGILAHEAARTSTPTRSWSAIGGEALAYLGAFSILGGVWMIVDRHFFGLSVPIRAGILAVLAAGLFFGGRALMRLSRGALQRLGGVLIFLSIWAIGGTLASVHELVLPSTRYPYVAFLVTALIGMGIALKGLRSDASLVRHLEVGCLLTSVAFLEFGLHAWSTALFGDDDWMIHSILVGAAVLFWHNRRFAHGLVTVFLTLHIVLFLPFALDETSHSQDLDDLGMWLAVLAICGSWMVLSERTKVRPRRYGFVLGGVITSIWLCFGAFEVKGDHVGAIIALAGSAAFLVMALRRKEPALFAFGALVALFAGPATAYSLFGKTLADGGALIASGLTLVGVGHLLNGLWSRVRGNE